jgi:hypothetical protein
MRERKTGGGFLQRQQHGARSRFGWGLGKGGTVQAAELDPATRPNNRDFSRSFLRHLNASAGMHAHPKR